jgi:hypothetical protein
VHAFICARLHRMPPVNRRRERRTISERAQILKNKMVAAEMAFYLAKSVGHTCDTCACVLFLSFF